VLDLLGDLNRLPLVSESWEDLDQTAKESVAGKEQEKRE
jgi:hypothetical protein